MSNILDSIHSLEVKLQNLVSKYEFLQEENEVILQNNLELQSLLQIEEQKYKNLEEKYNLLKVAKTIQGSNITTKETKLKINALIREIDKCIIHLNL